MAKYFAGPYWYRITVVRDRDDTTHTAIVARIVKRCDDGRIEEFDPGLECNASTRAAAVASARVAANHWIAKHRAMLGDLPPTLSGGAPSTV